MPLDDEGGRKCYFRIKLSCGHWIKTRDEPFSDRTKYGCTNGQGCGYRLDWIEVTRMNGDIRSINSTREEEK